MSSTPTVTERLRAAILAAGETRRRIAEATGLPESTLSRFVHGKQGLDGTSIDKLATYFGFELVKRGRQKKGR